MDFRQPEINESYHEELNTLLEEVRTEFGEDAAELFLYFVSGFSTAGGRAKTAAERIRALSLSNSKELKYDFEKQRFFFLRNGLPEYLNPYGSEKSQLSDYIVEAAFISHRAMVKKPPGDHFELAIKVVQEEYGKLFY